VTLEYDTIRGDLLQAAVASVRRSARRFPEVSGKYDAGITIGEHEAGRRKDDPDRGMPV